MFGLLLLLYLAALLWLGIRAGRRVHDEEDYLVAGRRLSLPLVSATLMATWFGAATLLGAAEAARVEGLRGTLLDPFASGVALVVAGLLFARRLWDMRLLTIGDFFARRFGPRAELAATVVLVPGGLGWIAAQYVALGSLLQATFGVPLVLGIVISAAVVMTLALVGGMWSVTLTDAAQLVVVLATLVILAWVSAAQLGDGSVLAGVDHLLERIPAEDLSLAPEVGLVAHVAWVSTCASGVLGGLPTQELVQRMFAARSARTAAWGCVLAGVAYIGFGLIPVGLGLASRLLQPTAQGDILSVLAQAFLSPALSLVFLLGVVSIVVSTATSAVLAPASLLGHNLWSRLPWGRRHRLAASRWSVVVVSLGGVVVALGGGTILSLLEASLSIVLVTLVVPLFGGVFGAPQGDASARLSMLAGGVTWGALALLEPGGPWSPVLLGLGASALGYGLGHAWDRRATPRPTSA
ncbi:MAG: sodium:solute symporter family protein [Myxococcales bacterium]|nr:sodium:solute symporter family protein [Myxococcales bacterium]